MYKKARAGEITGLTGLDAPYEAPAAPELHLRTDQMSVHAAVAAVLERLTAEGIDLRSHGLAEVKAHRSLHVEMEYFQKLNFSGGRNTIS